MKKLAFMLCGLCLPVLALAGQNLVDDGWSTASGYRFSGRLTEDEHQPASAHSSKAVTLYRSTRLLFSSGAEGAVDWQVGKLQWQSRSDDHGYWSLAGNQPLPLAAGWHEIRSSLPGTQPGKLLVHDQANRFGIISDIDDTILVSNVPDKARLLKNSLAIPPEQRQAVAGMAALYSRLQQRNANQAASPQFYLSASPRQLTPGIRRFLAANQFPQGVLLLKEVGHESRDPLLDQQQYKLDRISEIMTAFPQVKFMLVGDDGERDPEVYAEIRQRYPQQVDSIWIRKVSPDAGRATYPGQRDLAELLKN
ncbi:phosphatase domain-containing protein [Chitinilyticum piscinae]|uniref:DUF2183 domain-containing protein n=1 Tax=Chitinilyticum piscinae TaxID=2866724 RepID=A0A8J7FIB8_9NEIS|nr:phosphatase domain-containing protein [Chitinilyticum piscinae]MBE9608327.1 DUF2183 domain-containing protein [Chitinilyticum piscinae]